KRALAILTISDSLVTHQALSAEDRQSSFKEMMYIALELALNIRN
ncbi:MAG: purine-nucleoside phosphorylase, partial [Christensenellales bacterium]